MAGNRTVRYNVLWDDAQVRRGANRTGAALNRLDGRTKASQAVFQNFSSTVTSRMGAAGDVAQVALDGIASKSLASGAALKLGVVAGAAAAGVALAKFGVDAAQKTSALNEQINGTKVTFRAASDEVLAFGETTATALGLSNRAALQFANSFGGMFDSAGVVEDQAAKMSTTMVRLASDIASFRDINIDDALNKLRSLLAGETEPGRTIGIFLNEAVVKAKALELGLGGTHRELTEGEKVMARYALILDQTKNAQGDFQRTSNSLANQQRVLNAQWEDFQATVGRAVIPVLTEVFQHANALLGVMSALPDAIGDLADKAGAAAGPLGDVVGRLGPAKSIFDDFADAAKETAKGALGPLGPVLDATGKGVDILKSKQDAAKQATEEYEQVTKSIASALEHREESEAEVTKGMERQEAAIRASEDANRNLRNATEASEDAQRNLAERQGELNDLLRKGATDAREVADAERALEQATLGVSDAQWNLRTASNGVADARQRVLDAERELRDLYKAAEPGDVKDAELGVRDALLSQERARLRLADAQTALKEARAGDDAREEKDAELSLKEAQLGLEQSTRSLTRAQQSQNEVQRQGKPTTDQLRDAQRNLRDANLALEAAARNQAQAQRGLREATNGVTEAQNRLREAQAGDPEFNDKLAKARRGVADAERGLRNAKEGVTDATFRLTEATRKETEALKSSVLGVQRLRTEWERLAALYPALTPFFEVLLGHLPPAPPPSAPQPGNIGRRMASGGVIRPRPGGTSVTVAEAGQAEVVAPLDKARAMGLFGNGGANFTYNITVNLPAGSNGEDVVAAIKRYESRNGRSWRMN